MAGRPSTHVPHKSLTQRSSPDLHPSHPPAYLPPTVTQGTPETAIPLDAVAPVRVVWRFDAQPACAVHVAALPARRPPLKLPGSRLRRPVRAPGPPPRPSAQFPAGQGRARTHMPARAAWKFSERKIRETQSPWRPHPPLSSRCIGRKGDIGSRACAVSEWANPARYLWSRLRWTGRGKEREIVGAGKGAALPCNGAGQVRACLVAAGRSNGCQGRRRGTWDTRNTGTGALRRASGPARGAAAVHFARIGPKSGALGFRARAITAPRSREGVRSRRSQWCRPSPRR